MPINKDMTNKFGICPSTGHLSVLFPEKEAERTPSNKIFLAIVLQGGAMIEIDGKNHLIYTGTLIYLYINNMVNQNFCNLFILYGCIYVGYTLFCCT